MTDETEDAPQADPPERDTRGHWLKGQSGNRAGKPNRSENYRKAPAQHAPDLIAEVIRQALAGDIQALTFCLGRIIPLLKSRAEPIPVAVPPDAGLPELGAAVVRAALDGRMTPEEAAHLLATVRIKAEFVDYAAVKRELEDLAP